MIHTAVNEYCPRIISHKCTEESMVYLCQFLQQASGSEFGASLTSGIYEEEFPLDVAVPFLSLPLSLYAREMRPWLLSHVA